MAPLCSVVIHALRLISSEWNTPRSVWWQIPSGADSSFRDRVFTRHVLLSVLMFYPSPIYGLNKKNPDKPYNTRHFNYKKGSAVLKFFFWAIPRAVLSIIKETAPVSECWHLAPATCPPRRVTAPVVCGWPISDVTAPECKMNLNALGVFFFLKSFEWFGIKKAIAGWLAQSKFFAPSDLFLQGVSRVSTEVSANRQLFWSNDIFRFETYQVFLIASGFGHRNRCGVRSLLLARTRSVIWDSGLENLEEFRMSLGWSQKIHQKINIPAIQALNLQYASFGHVSPLHLSIHIEDFKNLVAHCPNTCFISARSWCIIANP